MLAADRLDHSSGLRRLVLHTPLTLGIAVLYVPVLGRLSAKWAADDAYSYGFLVPVISGYLIWYKREEVSSITPEPAPALGTVGLLAALGMLVVGRIGGILALEAVALVGTAASLVLFLRGLRLLWALALPVAYLGLMIPVWGLLTDPLHAPFQRLSAGIGVALLQALGIPAHQNGLFIELPRLTLEVARSCSGVNYLVAVVAIGIPLAGLFVAGWWRRTGLLAFAVAIAIFGNGLRVAAIGTLAHSGFEAPLHGPFHVFGGLFVSAIGFAGLFLALGMLGRGPHAAGDCSAAPVAAGQAGGGQATVRPQAYLAAGVALVLLAGAVFLYRHETQPIPLGVRADAFPVAVGEWRLESSGAPATPRFPHLGVDRELSAAYRGPDGRVIHVYVGYYERQAQDRELDLFRDHVDELGEAVGQVTVGPGLSARALAHRDGVRQRTLLFWLWVNGRTTTSRYVVKLYTLWDALRLGRTNGAAVLVWTDDPDGSGTAAPLAALERFTTRLSPAVAALLGGT